MEERDKMPLLLLLLKMMVVFYCCRCGLRGRHRGCGGACCCSFYPITSRRRLGNGAVT